MTEPDQSVNADIKLDACGLYCPEPVMLLHNKIRDMQPAQILELTATDPSTTRDVRKFCTFLGHELLQAEEHDGVFIYWIKKSS